jgi:hypothetical protein
MVWGGVGSGLEIVDGDRGRLSQRHIVLGIASCKKDAGPSRFRRDGECERVRCLDRRGVHHVFVSCTSCCWGILADQVGFCSYR